jgi:hypothetical protein
MAITIDLVLVLCEITDLVIAMNLLSHTVQVQDQW